MERIELGLLMAEPPVSADQGVDTGLAVAVRGRCRRRQTALLAASGTAPGRLLAAELESGEKRIPLGINAGGVALPLRIKRVQLRAILG